MVEFEAECVAVLSSGRVDGGKRMAAYLGKQGSCLFHNHVVLYPDLATAIE